MNVFVADAHCDSLYRELIQKDPNCIVTPETLKKGGVAVQTFAMFIGEEGEGDPVENVRLMFEKAKDYVVPFYTGALPETPDPAPHGILSIEGGEGLGNSLDFLAEIDDSIRLRMIALTWNYENDVATPAFINPKGGVKPFGRDLLKEMDRRGILPDVSHLNVEGFWDVCELCKLPPIASHSCCRWLLDSPRNLYKDQVEAIVARKGFIGVNFFTGFLTGDKPSKLDDVYRHIDQLMEMGAEDVVGFGSDFDGISRWPEGLADPSDIPNLLKFLSERGYSDALLEKLAGKNFWRVLREADAMRAV